MYIKILTIISFVTLAASHDVIVGLNTDGKKIFDENREANPAIWRQIENVTINTNGEDVIKRVVITDLRPEKDGDAKIVDGGEGQKNVTIELKSPTVLRGFGFHIEVYAGPDDHTGNKDEDKPEDSVQNSNFNGNINPEDLTVNPDNTSTKTSTVEVSSEAIPIAISKENTRTSRDTNLATGTTEAISTTESSTIEEIKSTSEDNLKSTTDSGESTTANAVLINTNVPGLIGIDHLEHKDTRYNRDTEEVQADGTHKPSELENKNDGKLDLTPSTFHQNIGDNNENKNFPGRVNVHSRYPLYTTVRIDGNIEHKDNNEKTVDVPRSLTDDSAKSENSTEEKARNSRDINDSIPSNPAPISNNETPNQQPATSFNTPLINSQSTVNDGNFGLKLPIMPNRQNFGGWSPLVPKIESIPNDESSITDELTTESDATTVSTFGTESTTEFTTLSTQSTEQVSSTRVVYFQ